MKFLRFAIPTLLLCTFFACNKNGTSDQATSTTNLNSTKTLALTATSTEPFESGTKTAYATGNVTLATGSWTFNDALLGNSSSDKKNGTQSARIRNSGILSTNFDFTGGASTVTIYHAVFGSDASSTWQLWYSTNGGTSYTQTGSTITTSSASLIAASFTINVSGNIRFQIRKTDGTSNRMNIDDFSVSAYSNTSTAPTLTSISPNTATVGSSAFTLTATGTNFASNSTINWNGTALTTTYVSATSLTATIPATDISTVGTDSITVSTSGIGTSSALSFTVKALGIPVLTSITPNAAVAGSASFTLTATGSSFTGSSLVTWNGTALATTYVSATSLTAVVPAANISTVGTDSVKVVTTGTGSSAAKAFIVQSIPAPVLSSITPNSKTAGSASFTLTASGSNFLSTSVINWNGVALATTYVSATSLTATVPAANITTAGTVPVKVVTPGSATTGSITFTINPATAAGKKFLFDATKAETAGNADWVIDEDNNTPQRFPTPAQSTITASTPETYWTGSLSSWGIALVKAGNSVET
jgi:hypothetical protein